MLYPFNKPNVNIDAFMDEVYQWVNERISLNDFDTVNRWIGDINTQLCEPLFLRFILRITLPIKDKLSNRPEFFNKCKVLKIAIGGLE